MRAIIGFVLISSMLVTSAQAQTVPTTPDARASLDSARPLGTGPTDLNIARKNFEAGAARQAERDRKRDSKVGRTMGSICAGCVGRSLIGRAQTAEGKPRRPPLEKTVKPSD